MIKVLLSSVVSSVLVTNPAMITINNNPNSLSAELSAAECSQNTYDSNVTVVTNYNQDDFLVVDDTDSTRQRYQVIFDNNNEVKLGANAFSIGNPVDEKGWVYSYYIRDRNAVDAVRQSTNYASNSSWEKAIDMGSSFGRKTEYGMNQEYTYYEETTINPGKIDDVRRYSNELYSTSIGQTYFQLKAGTVWHWDQALKVYIINFIFYTKVSVFGGGPSIPYYASLIWNLGKSITFYN
ncbi:hypothetical protein [Mesoplasma seiffertii]|uniref:hypothetical protein n=1 Tax=Mesoplasma seiffertii TaxID=28224 RepID=UPI00047D05E0|nr:hypothetical protein [Mesoplasma seiffertii]